MSTKKPSMEILHLRVVDAAGRYFHAHKSFERTQGDDKETDKEFQIAQTELLRAYGKLLRGIKTARREKLHREAKP